MIMKANDLFESYLQTICHSKAQFEAINNLHKLYFESDMGKEVACEDGNCCDDGECKDGECKDGKCECEKGLNEAVGEPSVNIEAEAEKNGLTVPEYEQALDMFLGK